MGVSAPLLQKVCRTGFALVLMGFLAGCGGGDAEYVEVEAPPESEQAPMASAAHDHDHAAPEGPGFAYTLPEGWRQIPTQSMQLLSLEAGQPPNIPASVSVSAFPGDVGGQVANINRWRRQVGLGPVDPEAARSFVQPVTLSGMEGWQVDFTGPAPEAAGHSGMRTIVAVVSHQGNSWFFKILGTASAVEEERERFAEFLSSIRF